MHLTDSSRRRTVAGVLLALVAELAVALTAVWALRPVASEGTRPHRLLPAVTAPVGPAAGKSGSSGPPRARHDPGGGSTTDHPAGSGGSTASWSTSRGYPVLVEHASAPSTHRTASASYAWLLESGSDAPSARWNPCAPIVVRVNPSGFDAAALADIRWALDELEGRTGLEVRLGDHTSETVAGTLSSRDWVDGTWTTASRRSWAPVLLFGSDAARTPELAGATTGWTQVRTDGAGTHLVSGVVAVDVEDLRADEERAAGLRLLLLHELGHLVGLGHVEDPDLVMHPYAMPAPGEAPRYRRRDRLGLAAAGRGPC